jgi:hypothetical protein
VRNEAALLSAGWTLIFVWQHDDLADAADRIESTVRARSSSQHDRRNGVGRRSGREPPSLHYGRATGAVDASDNAAHDG